MRLIRLYLAVVLGVVSFHQANGKYAIFETQQVPIERVLKNLQLRLEKNTNDVEATYGLARVHSMAYSTNLVEVPFWKERKLPLFEHPSFDPGVPPSVGTFATAEARRIALRHLTNAITLYERAIVLLKKSTNFYETRWMVLPSQVGLGWCLEQVGRTNDAIAMYRKTLKVAWKMEVTGDFDFKQWVSDAWGDVKAGRNPIRTHKRGFLGEISYSDEVIGYLLGLLDPVGDAEEISQLNKDKKTLSRMGRAISPILIPLEANTEFGDLVQENASVAFDLDGSGFQRKWGWITPKAGWLVFDPERTGRIESALQMFGNVTFWIFWPNGYVALSALDDNGDGVLSGAELRGLAIWNDRNCDGVSDPGEVTPVEQFGIEVISCRSQADANGMHWNPVGVVFTNGTSRASYDWIVPGSKATTERRFLTVPGD
jgi:hypothetical protein